MSGLFASGFLVDLILAGMVAEGLVLAAYHLVTGRGVAPRDFLANLLSGMCLLLAMRVFLAGAWWGWASAALLAALMFHVADIARLWDRRPRSI